MYESGLVAQVKDFGDLAYRRFSFVASLGARVAEDEKNDTLVLPTTNGAACGGPNIPRLARLLKAMPPGPATGRSPGRRCRRRRCGRRVS